MFNELVNGIGDQFRFKQVKTTGVAFKLITKISVNILICAALLISLRQFFGDPIECATDSYTYKKAIETSCWLDGLFINKALVYNSKIGKDITRYGVGPRQRKFRESSYIQQNYYQWVIPVLLLQSLFLYLPRILWHIWENGLMTQLITADSLVPDDAWKQKKQIIVRFMKEVSRSQHRRYVIKYIVCEILACLAVIFNMYIMHSIFFDFWIEYRPAATALFNRDFSNFARHSSILFPTQAKCFYFDFGPSGSPQVRDALCILPQNAVNEKIFAFLYFWYPAMLIFMVLNLTSVGLMMTLKCLRQRDIRRMSDHFFSRRFHDFYSRYSDFGYWYTLHLFHKNLNPILFKDLVSELIEAAEPRKYKLKFEEDGERIGDMNKPGNQSDNIKRHDLRTFKTQQEYERFLLSPKHGDRATLSLTASSSSHEI